MMKRLLTLLFTLAIFAAFGGVKTNTTSAVTKRGWKRTHIIGLPGGKLLDASGKVADYVSGKAYTDVASNQYVLIESAMTGCSNALQRLYAVTNRIELFKKKLFVMAHTYPDMVGRDNFWMYTAQESTDGTNDYAYIYFSVDITNSVPVVKRRYISETGTNIVQGTWVNYTNDNFTIDGCYHCRRIVFERPEEMRRLVVYPNPYATIGDTQSYFDFGPTFFTVNGEEYYTGAWTNAQGKVFRWSNGVKVGGVKDVQ